MSYYRRSDLWVERYVFFVLGILVGVGSTILIAFALNSPSVPHNIELTPNPIEIPARTYDA